MNESEVVISFLLDDAAVERVYLGTNGLLTGRVEGRLFIDMSTVSPGTHVRIAPAMASRNAELHRVPRERLDTRCAVRGAGRIRGRRSR